MDAFGVALNKYLDLQTMVPDTIGESKAVARAAIRDSVTRIGSMSMSIRYCVATTPFQGPTEPR